MRRLGLMLGLVAVAGCGGRPERLDTPLPREIQSVGLSGSVAVRDDGLDRILMLTSPSERRLATTGLAVGKNVVHWQVGPHRRRLYVLSEGVRPRLNPDDELPSLTIIDGGGVVVEQDSSGGAERSFVQPFVLARYTLDGVPNPKIDIDPWGEYAVVSLGGGVVENPNELLLVELPPPDAKEPMASGDLELTPKTIRSFGSSPEAITFTPPMRYPDGVRRMLIVQTAQEVALVDLEHPEDEVTVKLSEPIPGQVTSRPVEVVVHENDPEQFGLLPDEDTATQARDRYPLIAIRMENESTIPFLSFEPAPEDTMAEEDGIVDTRGVDFLVTVNLAEARGVPEDIDFFWTEVNDEPVLRLAAVLRTAIDGEYRAALIDPVANRTDFVEVGAPYGHMTRITDEIANEPRRSDVALLWGPQADTVAFWELGTTGSSSFRSVDAHNVNVRVNSVLDITQDGSAPSGAEHDFGHLKILRGSGASDFYVLDLDQRETNPMATPGAQPSISLSPDGQRAWVFQQNNAEFASLRFSDLHPTRLEVERAVVAVHEIAQGDLAEDGRAVFALHRVGDALGVTVLDGSDPDTADTRFYGGILLGGLR